MQPSNLPEGSSLEGHRRDSVEDMLSGLVGRCGYYSIIYSLMNAVRELAGRSMADPDNAVKQREFGALALAVRAAIERHEKESTFEHRVTESDRSFARRMGITLD